MCSASLFECFVSACINSGHDESLSIKMQIGTVVKLLSRKKINTELIF